MEEIERCLSYKAYWDGDTVSCGAGMGTTLCKFLFPNLQDTPSKHDLGIYSIGSTKFAVPSSLY